MTTMAAFKAYKVAIIRPAMVRLQEHFIAPIATIIARYVGISTTREEHFARIMDTRCITHEQSFSYNTSFKVTFTLADASATHRGPWLDAEFRFEYIECGTSLSRVYRHGDPHVQYLDGALAMFDVHQAFASRLIVAGSWSRVCDHLGNWVTPCRCARIFFKRHVDKIITELHAKYNYLANDVARGESVELGYKYVLKPVVFTDSGPRPGEWIIPHAGDYHQRAYIDLTHCLETRPCSHSVRFADGHSSCLSSVAIHRMFVERGIEPPQHFA
jgi:hypothetical protein